MKQANVSNAYSFQNVLNSAANKDGLADLVNCLFQFLREKRFFDIEIINTISCYNLSA